MAETGQTFRHGGSQLHERPLHPGARERRLAELLKKATWLFVVLMLLTLAAWQTRQLLRTAEPLPVLDTLGGDFALPSTRGGITPLAEFRGRRVLLNFGYTGCPDVCPTALAKMRDVVAAFAREGEPVEAVFVTLDPEHDDLERLGPYLAFFHESFVGMTGSRGEIDAVAALYKVFHEPVPPADGGGIAHSSHIYLLDGDGRVRSTFDGNVPVTRIVETVAALGH